MKFINLTKFLINQKLKPKTMKKRVLKTSIAAFAAAALLAGCGTTSLKTVKTAHYINQDVSSMTVKKGSLDKDQLKSWPEMDMLTDTVPGMSVERAYREIIQNFEGKKVIVGILDSGVDVNHEDLKDAIWMNKKEIAGNGKDDDGNGYVDDVYGWNFLGDAIHENLEYTRILKKLKPKYDGKSDSDISSADREEYELYKRAKAEYDEEVTTATNRKAGFERQVKQIKDAIDLLKENAELDNMTQDDIAAIETDEADVNMAKMIISSILANGIEDTDALMEEVDRPEVMEYFNSKLKYHLGLDFDGRSITGDNVNDITDTNYGNNQVAGPDPEMDDAVHGTHVAGIVGAVRNNGIGMNGVAHNVELMAIRAVPDGDEYDKDIALGIRYAVDNGAKVINMSFGKYFSTNPEWVIDAIKYAEKHDVLLVKAAGNDALDLDEHRVYPNDQWPGQDTEIASNVIVVGALNPTYGENMVASFSNYGRTSVDVFAPGVQIYATVPLNKYQFLQGTSMAAPGVAGIAALIRSYYPKLTAAQVKKVIMDSGITTDIEVILGGDPNNKRPFNQASKSGRMANLYNALIYASKM